MKNALLVRYWLLDEENVYGDWVWRPVRDV